LEKGNNGALTRKKRKVLSRKSVRQLPREGRKSTFKERGEGRSLFTQLGVGILENGGKGLGGGKEDRKTENW